MPLRLGARFSLGLTVSVALAVCLAVGGAAFGRVGAQPIRSIKGPCASVRTSQGGRLTSAITLRGQAKIYPAPAKDSPAVSQAAAISTAIRSGLLGIVTATPKPNSAVFGEVTAMSFQRRPMWIVTFPDRSVAVEGGYAPKDEKRQGSYGADLRIFVDATTGSYLFAVADSSCR